MRDAPRKKRDRARSMNEVEAERERVHMAPLERRIDGLAKASELAARQMWTPEQSWANWKDVLGLRE